MQDSAAIERVVRLPSGGALHVAGPAGAPALLLLHGVGGGAWSWKPQVAALQRTFRLAVWEARGHGAAARVADAGLADYFTDAREALAAVVAESDAPVVAGHSMGGLLALALAVDRPEGVAGLYLIDPVYGGGRDERAYGHVPRAFGGVARRLAAPLVRSVERGGPLSARLARWMFAQSFEDRRLMETAWLDQREQRPLEYPRMLNEAFTGPLGFTQPDARDVRVPVAVLEGSSAARGPRFPALVDALGALGDAFAYERIAGGHYLQLDRPLEVTVRLRAFATAVLAQRNRAKADQRR